MKGILAVATILSMVFLMIQENHAIDCAGLDISLLPCLPYLTVGGTPAGACCNAVRGIKQFTATPEDRRAVCECLKQAATRYQAIRQDVAAQLPKLCNVDFNVSISRDIDCTK